MLPLIPEHGRLKQEDLGLRSAQVRKKTQSQAKNPLRDVNPMKLLKE